MSKNFIFTVVSKVTWMLHVQIVYHATHKKVYFDKNGSSKPLKQLIQKIVPIYIST